MIPQPEDLGHGITLFQGDCLEILPTLEPGSVDAVITDPPYGVGFKYNTHDDTQEGYSEWCEQWFAELVRVCDGVLLISCGLANIGMWQNIKKPTWVLCWHKPASMGRCAVGFNNWEPVLVYGNGLKSGCDVFQATIKPDSSVVGHPCPKPLAWALQQVKKLKDNSTILDPFAGSGTTGVAALLEGRRCILIEKDPHYCEIIRKRIRDASGVGPGTLFAGAADLFAEVAT